ncbi:MAG: hypothetical protein AAF502_06890 [Bacteroidota bacterium]
MKNLLFGCAFLFVMVLASACKSDNANCTTCTGNILGIDTTVEACQDGDDVIVTTTALGVSQSETQQNTTVATITDPLPLAGYTCN